MALKASISVADGVDGCLACNEADDADVRSGVSVALALFSVALEGGVSVCEGLVAVLIFVFSGLLGCVVDCFNTCSNEFSWVDLAVREVFLVFAFLIPPNELAVDSDLMD